MDLDQAEEAAASLPAPVNLSTLDTGSGDKYLTVRRHTVGPGDTAHEQVILYLTINYNT